MTAPAEALVEAIRGAVDPQRLLDTAVALVEVPSPTRSAGAAAARLAEILAADGFDVERPVADWPESPAVVARLRGGDGGRTLQLAGHIDTVHLPFAPPVVTDGVLSGSGAADMKGGLAAAVEAMRCLRDLDLPETGGVLLTVWDHHEGPWGDARQADAVIRDGFVGDAALVPEYLADRLPGAGRGMAIFEVRLHRDGEPVHEVLRPAGLPDVVGAGAELVRRLGELDARLAAQVHPVSGRSSVFTGYLQAGEIFNQAPVECHVRGTRRWVTPGQEPLARRDISDVVAEVSTRFGVAADLEISVMGDAFELAADDDIVVELQAACRALTGTELPWGDKPFLDDGNRLCTAGVPTVTHGPAGTGAHTTREEVALAELQRVARLYALTAARFAACGG